MIQIWQVPSECGPSNLVVLELVHSAHWTEKYLISPDLESTPWSRINPDWQDSEVGLAISGDAR